MVCATSTDHPLLLLAISPDFTGCLGCVSTKRVIMSQGNGLAQVDEHRSTSDYGRIPLLRSRSVHMTKQELWEEGARSQGRNSCAQWVSRRLGSAGGAYRLLRAEKSSHSVLSAYSRSDTSPAPPNSWLRYYHRQTGNGPRDARTFFSGRPCRGICMQLVAMCSWDGMVKVGKAMVGGSTPIRALGTDGHAEVGCRCRC